MKNRSHNSEIRYDVAYRDVKYPRLEFKTGKLLVIAPKSQDIGSLLDKHNNWLLKKNNIIESALATAKKKKLNVERTDEELKKLSRKLAEKITKELRISLKNIYFRKMKTKWASCSTKGNLTLNTLLKYLPKSLIEYVVYHEIVHLIEKRHNKNFWGLISNRFPNYPQKEKKLLVYWFLIQRNT